MANICSYSNRGRITIKFVWSCFKFWIFHTFLSSLGIMFCFSNSFLFIFGQELVPCVLLSFDDEQILMWRGKDWKSMYPEPPSFSNPVDLDIAGDADGSGTHLRVWRLELSLKDKWNFYKNFIWITISLPMTQMGRHLIFAIISHTPISLLAVNVIPKCHVGGFIAERKDCKLHVDSVHLVRSPTFLVA